MSEQTPKPEETKLEKGPFGQFLESKGVSSKRLADCIGVETIEIDGQDLLKAAKLLREDSQLKMDLLACLSGTDSPDSFDSVYHFWSYENENELVVKIQVLKSSIEEDKLPLVPSLSPMWPAANWHERETYDLVGIQYEGHPYLRRILNPWDWEGHPLRRDYKQPIDALNDKNPVSFR